jgi:hypothetical protein
LQDANCGTLVLGRTAGDLGGYRTRQGTFEQQRAGDNIVHRFSGDRLLIAIESWATLAQGLLRGIEQRSIGIHAFRPQGDGTTGIGVCGTEHDDGTIDSGQHTALQAQPSTGEFIYPCSLRAVGYRSRYTRRPPRTRRIAEFRCLMLAFCHGNSTLACINPHFSPATPPLFLPSNL